MARDESYGGPGAGSSVGSGMSSVIKNIARPKPARKITTSVKKIAGRVTRMAPSAKRSSGSNSGSGSGRRETSNRGGNPRLPSSGGGKPKGPTNNQGKPPKVPIAPKKPTIPGINTYLGTDATYQDVVRGGKRSLEDFLSDLGRRRGESETQFGVTKGSMERDRVQQLEDLRNEFASRGLINSGLYGQEQGEFQEQFTQQQTALEAQQASLLADLLSQEKNYRREQELALEAARQEALQRRVAKYNIGA